MTTLGTELSNATGAWRRRAHSRQPRDDAAARRLAGTVWERVELAGVLYRASLGVGRVLARLGVSANAITYLSMGIALVACVAAATGEFLWASLAVIVSGICDALDGIVARSTGTESRFGALLDSTIDRVTDALPLVGIMLFFGSSPLLALIPALALLGSFVIPYARARAEALGIQLPALFMRRPERVVLVVLCLLLGELPIEAPVAAPLLLSGLVLLTVLNTWGAVAVLRAARTHELRVEASSSDSPARGRR